MPTVAFQTLGCKLNQAETAMMVQDFKDHRYRIVQSNDGADVFVLNTCTVTGRTDARCRQAIRRVLRSRPETTVIVAGCLAQVAADEMARIPGVDYIFGSREKFEIFNHFKGPGKQESPVIFSGSIDNLKKPVPHTYGDYRDQTRAFLKIQSGCNQQCTYCIVPRARGPSRSVPEAELARQVRSLVQAGYREIVLTGVHIGFYGKETGGVSQLPDLLETLCNLEGPERLRLSSLDPNDVSNALMDCITKHDRICRHFHIPLQSGSDATLKAMRRGYDTKVYRKKLKMIASRFRHYGLGTDVIVGFPGETEDLFKETVKFVREQPFTYLHVFPFSVRKGTEAADMANQVDRSVIIRRARKLQALASEKKQIFLEQWKGKTVQVLLESRNRRGRMGGLTSEYIRVEVPYDESLANQLVDVQIELIEDGFVRGKVI